MKLADKGLNTSAQAIEEAQGEIRQTVLKGYLKGEGKNSIAEQVKKIINRTVKLIAIPYLKNAAERSLNAFANSQYRILIRAFGYDNTKLAALLALNGAETNGREFIKARNIVLGVANLRLQTEAKGVPLQEFAKKYFEEKVRPVFERLSKDKPLNPDDVSERNTLRNLAEMEVRYKANQDSIEDLKIKRVRLVVCSVHADCSDRCYPWQGRVYSLDGTSGITQDGKKYIPLEQATDIYYITKAGRTYKNGLLGFNCRHKLYEYKPGIITPQVSRQQQQKEQKINTRQRELERRVREYRQLALYNKEGGKTEDYFKYKRLAVKANKDYIAYSHANGRAYYPTRITVI